MSLSLSESLSASDSDIRSGIIESLLIESLSSSELKLFESESESLSKFGREHFLELLIDNSSELGIESLSG